MKEYAEGEFESDEICPECGQALLLVKEKSNDLGSLQVSTCPECGHKDTQWYDTLDLDDSDSPEALPDIDAIRDEDD